MVRLNFFCIRQWLSRLIHTAPRRPVIDRSDTQLRGEFFGCQGIACRPWLRVGFRRSLSHTVNVAPEEFEGIHIRILERHVLSSMWEAIVQASP